MDWSDIAHYTEGFSGADLENLLREAAMHAVREHLAQKEGTNSPLVVQARHVRLAYDTPRSGARP